MGLERNREKEKQKKMKEKKDKLKYSDNKINVSINIGSEDLIDSKKDNQEILDSYNQDIVLPEDVPTDLDKDDKMKIDNVDNLLTELRGNLNEFNSKKKKLMDSNIDIPNDIFDLPDIDLQSEGDIKKLNLMIKEKINKLDSILLNLKPELLPFRPVSTSTIQPPSMIGQPFMRTPLIPPMPSRASPFAFPTIPRPIPTQGVSQIDYVSKSSEDLNNWKIKYNSLINSSDIPSIKNLVTESNNLEKILNTYKKNETDESRKNLIQNDIKLLGDLRSNLNMLIDKLPFRPTEPTPEGPTVEPVEPEPTPSPEGPTIETLADKNKISKRLEVLNRYQNSIYSTGRAPKVVEFLNNQINYIKNALQSALKKDDLTENEANTLLSFNIDLDKGTYPAVRAYRITNPSGVLGPNDKLELREFSNPQLPLESARQYKLYINNEVLTAPKIGDVIFNEYGDLYRREDIEGGDIIPEEPQPVTPEITEARRNQLLNYRNNLYFTGRNSIDDIVNLLNNEIERALQEPDGFTTMDLTRGRVPEAIAWRTSFPNMNPRDSSGNIEFEAISRQFLPGGADPAYYLKVDNQYVNRPDTTTKRTFNRFGGMYVGNDQKGFDPRLEFPFSPAPEPETPNVPDTTVPEIPTGPWNENFNDDAERAYLKLYNRELVNIPPEELSQLSFVRPMIPFDPEDETGGGPANYFYLKINGVENPRYRFTLDTFDLIEEGTQGPQSTLRPFPIGRTPRLSTQLPPIKGLSPLLGLEP